MSPNLDKDRSSRTPVIVRVIIRTIQHRQTPTKHNIRPEQRLRRQQPSSRNERDDHDAVDDDLLNRTHDTPRTIDSACGRR